MTSTPTTTISPKAATEAGALDGHEVVCSCGARFSTSLGEREAQNLAARHIEWHAQGAKSAVRLSPVANDGETVGASITVTDLGRPVQAQVVRISHASVDVETISGKVWRFWSTGRELANAKFVRGTASQERALAAERRRRNA